MSIIQFPKRKFQIPWALHNITVFIVIISVGVFFLNMIRSDLVGVFLALIPANVTNHGFFWTTLTYLFFHMDPIQLVFNMLAFFFIGYEVEKRMGSWHFLLFFLGVGIGVGLLSTLGLTLVGAPFVPVYGASGIIYGLLMAYACFFPWNQLYVFGVLPVRAPWLVVGYAGIDILLQLSNLSGMASHLMHLSGTVIAFVIMLLAYRLNFFDTLRKP